MAIEYDLDLSNVDVQQVARLMNQTATTAGLTSLDDEEQRYGDDGALLDSGLLIVANPATPLPFPDPLETEFGITPTVGVLFRFGRDTDSLVQEHEMMQLTCAVLAATPADAVLAFAGESVHLVRKDGKLTISDQDDFWTSEILTLLPQSYERTHFSVL